MKFGQLPRTSSVKTEGVIAGGFNTMVIAAGIVLGLFWFLFCCGVNYKTGRCVCVCLTL